MEINFSWEILTEHPVAWSFLIIFLACLIYAMKAIKKEKSVFIENATPVNFGPYVLQTPSWWSITDQSESFIKFERTDTRYDWFAIFEIKKINETNVIEDFKSRIEKRELLFDVDAGVIHEDRFMKRGALINSSVARVEGTATQHGTERVYYDAMLAKDHELEIELWAESKSSVLNGLVEGPYFEYVIQNLKKR